MEGGIVQQDFDELDMLLEQIPNATSGNHLLKKCGLAIPSKEFPVASIGREEFSSRDEVTSLPSFSSRISEPYTFPQPAMSPLGVPSNGGTAFSISPEHQKLERIASSSYEFPEVIIHREDNSNLPDEMSLTLFIEEMSINENLTSKPCSPSPVKNLNLALLHGSEPSQIPESLRGNFSEHPVICPMNSMAIPANQDMNTYQLLPSAPGLQLPNIYQPNYYADTQSHPSHLSKPVVLWNGMEEEGFGQLCQQYLHAQHLQNQRSEVVQVQKSMKFGLGPYHGNTLHQSFEFPMSQQHESCNQSQYSHDNSNCDKSYLLDYCQYQHQHQESTRRHKNLCFSNGQNIFSSNGLSYPAMDFQGHQIFDKVGKQSVPEINLMKSHGVNSFRVLRSNPIAPDQALFFDENYFRWLNGNAHSPHGLNNGSLKLDKQLYTSSCPEIIFSSRTMLKRYNSVDEVAGRILMMAKDQHGCRFLQKKFAEGSQEDINKIFTEIIFHVVELMTDPFGNYLVQKLLDVCNEEQLMLILKVITRNTDELIKISCDMHGTRVVQKIIETVRTPEQIYVVVSSLEPYIVSVMKHINGNHVAQRCLQYLSKYSKLLVDAAISHCVELATDRQGCCVLQKCLVHSDDDQRLVLVAEISSFSLFLSKDQYGNYVVQYILELRDPWATAAILKQLAGNYDHLAVQKYSSNVVEKCLKLAGKEDRSAIIREMIRSSLLLQILQDPYGNYVIQTALTESKVQRDLHADLVEAILSHAPALRSSPYGKKVLSNALLSSKK